MALAMAVLVGCTGPGTESGGADSSADGSAAMPEPAPEGPGGSPLSPVDTDPDRQVVTTATASLAVEDPAEGAQRVSELVESVGGRVDERTEQAASGDDGVDGAVADLVVRVPADALTGVLADLEDLGDVEHVSVSRSDVTAGVVDLDARIAALQTSVARLQALMDGAATTEALLAAEEALSERQANLESLRSQRALLADGGPDGFLGGLGTGWRALVAALGAAVVVLGVLLPWLVVAGLIAGGVLVPVRLARRRAGAAAAPAPPEDDGEAPSRGVSAGASE